MSWSTKMLSSCWATSRIVVGFAPDPTDETEADPTAEAPGRFTCILLYLNLGKERTRVLDGKDNRDYIPGADSQTVEGTHQLRQSCTGL